MDFNGKIIASDRENLTNHWLFFKNILQANWL